MVKLHPVKSLVPVSDGERPAASRASAPNRFRSQSYDRSVFGSDDCTKETGKCSCCMCSTTPLVIIPSGEPICSQYNITLRNVQEYLDGGLLKTLHEESFMIYRQIKCDGTCQIGIFAAIEVDDCAKRVVRPHEKVTCKTDITVHNKPVQLRQSYMDPVMLLYRESSDINAVVDRIVSQDEPFESIDGDGDTPGSHHIWTVKDPADIAAIQRAFEGIDHLYIADGHHRAAAACKESARLSSGNAVNVAQSSRFLTALIFPDSHLNVLSYNRCVSAWPPGLTQADFLCQVSRCFSMEPLGTTPPPSSSTCLPAATETGRNSPHPIDESRSRTVSDTTTVSDRSSSARGSYDSHGGCTIEALSRTQDPAVPHEQFVMYMYVGTQWYRLDAPMPCLEELCVNPLKGVGCQILLDKVLWPILHTNDSAVGTHMIYVDGRMGSAGISEQVQQGHAVVGFMVSAVPAHLIMQVADADLILPAKATFFDPKPMSNLLLRLFR